MQVETYLIQYNGELYVYSRKGNQRGFTYEEAKRFIEENQLENAILISIKEELKRFKLLEDPVNDYKSWHNAYMNNNINGIKLPIYIDTNREYIEELENIFNKYLNEINTPAFAYENGLVLEIENICKDIIIILKMLIKGDILDAEHKLKNMIEKFSVHSFFVNELDKSYSFRGIAPYIDLQRKGYEDVYREMREQELSFFRVRTKKGTDKTDISKLKDIVHLPYENKGNASNARFSRARYPCLYLGTTTYVCCKECGWDESNEEMFAASFIPNEQGKKLRILNLTISQALINGIYRKSTDKPEIEGKLQIMMLKIFPLVIATSFSINEKDREIKYEYLISQTLMKIIKEMGIDGIAYLSMKGKDEFQYPQGVNLALPAWDITKEKQYSSICDKFTISLPKKFCQQVVGTKKSYINSIYKKVNEFGRENYISKTDVDGENIYYGDTKYGKFDNFLVSQSLYNFEN